MKYLEKQNSKLSRLRTARDESDTYVNKQTNDSGKIANTRIIAVRRDGKKRTQP